MPQKGDMLLTSVGTLGIPYIIKDETFYFKDGNLTWFYNFNGINSKFLYYWFLSPTGKNTIEVNAIGSTQKALTIDTLSKIRINIPNFKIQNKIVAILSSLGARQGDLLLLTSLGPALVSFLSSLLATGLSPLLLSGGRAYFSAKAGLALLAPSLPLLAYLVLAASFFFIPLFGSLIPLLRGSFRSLHEELSEE